MLWEGIVMIKFINKYFKVIVCTAVLLFAIICALQHYILIQYSENLMLSDRLIHLQEARIAHLKCQLLEQGDD